MSLPPRQARRESPENVEMRNPTVLSGAPDHCGEIAAIRRITIKETQGKHPFNHFRKGLVLDFRD